MSEVIANIASIDGKFFAKAADGSLRELSRGDEVYEGEVIVGDHSNGPTDSIIVSMEDGTDIVILGDEQQLFDSSLSSEEFAENETVSNAESIEAFLGEYGDIDDIETAAGEDIISSEETATQAIFAEVNNATVDVSSELRESSTKNVTQNSLYIEDDSEDSRRFEDSTNNAEVDALASNVDTLTQAATDATDAANEAARAADTAAQTAQNNPTPANLAAAEDAQEVATDAAIDASNAANTLEAAITTLEVAADAAGESVDTAAATAVVADANTASSNARTAVSNSESATDSLVVDANLTAISTLADAATAQVEANNAVDDTANLQSTIDGKESATNDLLIAAQTAKDAIDLTDTTNANSTITAAETAGEAAVNSATEYVANATTLVIQAEDAVSEAEQAVISINTAVVQAQVALNLAISANEDTSDEQSALNSATDVQSISLTTLTDANTAFTNANTELSIADATLTAASGLDNAIESMTFVDSGLSSSSDTGSIDLDSVTADNTPTILGNGETGSTVVITNEAGETVGSAVIGDSGTYSITTDALSDGTQNLTVTSTDAAGNVVTVDQNITIDTGVVAPTVDLSNDSDNTTNSNTPTLNGTAEAGSEVVVYDGSSVIGTTIADEDGNWSVDSSTLSDGIHHISVTTTDTAGNVFESSGISAVSSGYDDANRGGVGTTVNNEFHRTTRGVGVTVVDEDGNFVSHETFDTYGSVEASAALVAKIAEINENAEDGSQVVITTQDEWVNNLSDDAKDALISIGGDANILNNIDSGDKRSSYQLITEKTSDGWESESEDFHDRYSDGPITGHSDESMETVIVDTTTTSSVDLAASSDSGSSDSDNITNDSTFTLTSEATSNAYVGVGERGATIEVTNEAGEVLGTARVSGNGNYSITMPEMEDGVHNLTITSTDVAGNISVSTQSVTVDTSINASADTNSIDEDADTVSGNVSLNDDSGSSVTAATIVGAHGTVVIEENGEYTYTLNSSSDAVQGLNDGESLNDSFTYTTTDVAGNTTTATLSIDVNGTNDIVSQVIDTDTAANSVDENVADGTYTGVTLNATDADSQAVTYSVEEGVPFSVNENGEVVTSGEIDFEDSESFTFTATATSADGTSSTQEITVDVNNINEGITAVDDGASSRGNITNGASAGVTVTGIYRNGSEENVLDGVDEPLVTSNTHNYFEHNGYGETGYNYMGGHDYFADNNISFNDFKGGVITFSDGTMGVIDTASNGITREGGADESAYIYYNAADGIEIGQAYYETTEDKSLKVDVTSNDVDGDGLALTVMDVENPVTNADGVEIGTATISGGNIIFTPNDELDKLEEGESQNINFEYSVQNAQGESSTAEVNINVVGTNDTPEIIVLDTTAVEDISQVIANVSDIDGTVESSNLSADNGTLSIAENGDITYTPDENFNGTDNINIAVTDNSGETTTQTFSVDVEAVNDGPIASDDTTSAIGVNNTGTDGALVLDSTGDNPELLGGATSVEVTMSLSGEANQGATSLFSYASSGSNNEFLIFSDGNNVRLYLDGDNVNTGITANELFDGELHELNVSWDSATGEAQFHLDGSLEGTQTIAQGHIIDSNGVLMLGQEQDSVGGYLDVNQIFRGEYQDVSVSVDGVEAAHWDMNSIDSNGLVSDSIGNFDLSTTGDVSQSGERVSTDEDNSIVVDVLANDTDIDGDSLSVTQVDGQDVTDGNIATIRDINGEILGTATLTDEGKVEFTPGESLQAMDDGENQDVSFDYTVSDGTSTDTGSVTVNVTGSDDITVLEGTSGVDTIRGTDEAEIIYGNEGDDKLYGNDGDDIISGGAGRDVIYGGEGADTLDGGEGSSDYVSYYDSDQGVNVNLATNEVSGGDAQGDTIVNFENVNGSANDDVLIGDDERNIMYGGAGDDIISTGAGDDQISGAEGNDRISGGEGTDKVVLHGEPKDYTIVENEDGTYTVTDLREGSDNKDGVDTLDGIEQVRFDFTDANGISHYNTYAIEDVISVKGELEITNIVDTNGDFTQMLMNGSGVEAGSTITLYNTIGNIAATTTVLADNTWKVEVSNLDGTPINYNEFFSVSETSSSGVESARTDATQFAYFDFASSSTEAGDDYDIAGVGNDNIAINTNDLNDKLVVDGGDGQDAVTFSGDISEFDIARDEQGNTIVTENVSTDSDGNNIGDVNELRNIETINFNNDAQYIDTQDGEDTVNSGTGDDTIVFDSSDTVNAGDGLDTLLVSEDLNIDFTALDPDAISNIENIELADGVQNITGLSIDDVLDMTDVDNTLRIDGDGDDSINLNTVGEDAEWTLGDFKTDAETGATYQEYVGGEDDATVTLEINTEIDISES